MIEKRISAKDLVTFLYQGGDLTSESSSNKRAKQGTEAHSYLQAKYNEEDKKEVFVETLFDIEEYSFHITGRIDGVLQELGKTIIHEIKSTTLDLEQLTIDTRKEHLAQAKMYAYIYCINNDLKSINVRLTYITVNDFETKDFNKRFTITQLTKFFETTLKDYVKWQNIFEEHNLNREKSIEGLLFPFDEYRDGQKQFMGAVYQTMVTNDILYSVAPTGIGKTVGALFSSLKSIKEDKEKIFYLTAKNAGKKIAVDTVNLLKDKGLVCKTVVINSKENMCLQKDVDCDPDICPYAKGFYDRLNEALMDIFVHQDVYEMKLIKDYATFHNICPHEFSLEISNYSDIVICDYNYAFDPRSHLIRYFDEEYYSPKLLIDEAHNLVDRSRSMFSATLSLDRLKEFKKVAKSVKPSITSRLNKVIQHMEEFVKENDIVKARFHHQIELDYTLVNKIDALINKIDEVLSENKKFKNRKQYLDYYFDLLSFSRIADYYNSAYRYIIAVEQDEIVFKQKCMNASSFLYDIIEKRSFGTVFFSATLEPVDYYAALLSKEVGKQVVIPSPFKQSNLGLFVDQSVSTRYKDRKKSIPRIIDSIYAMLESRDGNYIVFFPSYQYLNQILEEFDTDSYEVIVQTRNMTYNERRETLDTLTSDSEKSTVGFFVLGGSFSEGIDYIGDMLHGVMIIGVGLPMFNQENELLKSYYDTEFDQGYDYAYKFPGMNKVIQAVGRVIRREEDKGIAVLIDDRFTNYSYLDLYPSHWSHYKVLDNQNYIQTFIRQFWKDKE